MNFGEALAALKEGKKISRAVWGGYWYLCKNVVIKHDPIEKERDGNGPLSDIIGGDMPAIIIASLKEGKGIAPAQPYQEDLLAEDWQIIN